MSKQALLLAQRALSNKNASNKLIYEALAEVNKALNEPDAERANVRLATSKHTPGPWYVSIITKANLTSPGGGIFISAVGKRIARIILSEAEINNRIDEHKANAALIAAAPDLLEALQSIQDQMAAYIHIANHIGVNDADGFYLGHALDVEKKARATIAKATSQLVRTEV